MIGVVVALAGGLGAGSRFILDGVLTARLRPSLPLGTVVINVLGSFLLGALAAWGAAGGSTSVVAVLGVGFLGGFTTFSTASVELVLLLRERRRLTAVMLGAAMLLLALAAAALGAWLALLF